jgi:hypothetical protein
VTAIQRIYRVLWFGLIYFISLPAQAQGCRQWGEAAQIGDLKAQLEEASGIAASRQFPGRLYHINDSGSAGAFYITGMDGAIQRAVRVAGFKPVDTEGLALGPCRGGRGSCLYIGDIGDNNRKRGSIEIVVLEEVRDFAPTVTPRSRLKLRYPDGPHDAESIAVDPKGTIFILTKERPAQLFKVVQSPPQQPTLSQVTTLDLDVLPTDMAISDDGTRLLIISYSDAVEYSMDFKQHQKIRLNFLQQQEGIAYLPGSRSFVYTTERLLPILPQWIMRVDCGDK